MSVKVPFYRHGLDSSFSVRMGDVLDTPFLTSGAVGRAVENQLCAFFGVSHCLLVNSWTNGAVATLLALGIGPGDEVIVPAMTFIATANVVELVGAKPVFVDVDPDTLLMTPEAVLVALTPATRAVIVVHMYGQMVDVKSIVDGLRHRPNMAIIEDSAHCFEGHLNGARPGQESDAAIFSFYATKNVTCGEGGAVITRRTDLYEKLAETRCHGMSSIAIDRFRGGDYRHWDMLRLGTKANLPDILAALLPPQIECIQDRLPVRERLCRRYEEAFADTPLRLVRGVPGAVSARHLFAIHVPPDVRDEAIRMLNANGIEVTVNYRSVPTLTHYREKYGYRSSDFPVSYQWGQGTLSLPLYPSLSEAQQDHVIAVVRDKVLPLSDRASRVA